jgi:DNA mismatch endonuclease (patch repair protein)
MADVFTEAQRSVVMSRIRGRENLSTEVRLITIMRSASIAGWRRHQSLPGRPDFVYRQSKLAIFVDGCFWHLCPKCGNLPKNNAEFWSKKLFGNRDRDRLVSKQLRALGWITLRIWEHELRDDVKVVKNLKRALGRTQKQNAG